jgi:small subunit ribosomal protein S13
MIRISGVNLPNEKRVECGLTYIKGIGPKTSQKILAQTKVNPDTRVKDLSDDEVAKIRGIIDNDYIVEADLRRQVMGDIKRLKEIKCYRGLRHIKNLPARGQRTKTNNRTVRGNKRLTLGSGRAKAAAKT